MGNNNATTPEECVKENRGRNAQCVKNESRVVGCLFGLAVGDAIGYVVEGNPAHVCERHFRSISNWAFSKTAVEPTFESYFPFGQVTDDTQIALLLLRAALEEGEESLAQRFARNLVGMQGKFVGLGMATSKSISKLVRGVSEKESGSPAGEAGNGPAVRGAVLGCVLSDKELVSASEEQSLVTHLDKRCFAGAVLMSFAVKKLIGLHKPLEVSLFVAYLVGSVREIDAEFSDCVGKLPQILSMSVADAAREISRFGVAKDYNDGFLRSPDSFWMSLETCLAGGGDTDSTCAMTGSLSGAFNGCTGIPLVFLSKIHDLERKDLYAEIVGLVSK